MKKLGVWVLLSLFIVSWSILSISGAWAVPVFSRKYNVQCSFCHLLPPRLNKVGVAFKENGFEMVSPLPQSEVFGNQKFSSEDPKVDVPAGLPLTLRTGLDFLFSGNANPAVPVASTTAVPAASFREFHIVGGGNVGGLGFWLVAPNSALTALDVNLKFNDLAKVKVGVFEPASAINYGLGLQPPALGGIIPPVVGGVIPVTISDRNPIPNQNAFRFGNINSAVELHGTTNAASGMGFNYAIGYGAPAAGPAGNFTPNPASSLYGGISYLFEAINTNVGVSYASNSNVLNVAGSSSNTLLATATWNVGSPLQVIVAYNSDNLPGVGNSLTGWSIQPEYDMGQFWFGARYSTLTPGAAGAVSSNEFRVGAAYRFLQNVISSVTYVSLTNRAYAPPTALFPDVSAVFSSIDLVF